MLRRAITYAAIQDKIESRVKHYLSQYIKITVGELGNKQYIVCAEPKDRASSELLASKDNTSLYFLVDDSKAKQIRTFVDLLYDQYLFPTVHVFVNCGYTLDEEDEEEERLRYDMHQTYKKASIKNLHTESIPLEQIWPYIVSLIYRNYDSVTRQVEAGSPEIKLLTGVFALVTLPFTEKPKFVNLLHPLFAKLLTHFNTDIQLKSHLYISYVSLPIHTRKQYCPSRTDFARVRLYKDKSTSRYYLRDEEKYRTYNLERDFKVYVEELFRVYKNVYNQIYEFITVQQESIQNLTTSTLYLTLSLCKLTDDFSIDFSMATTKELVEIRSVEDVKQVLSRIYKDGYEAFRVNYYTARGTSEYLLIPSHALITPTAYIQGNIGFVLLNTASVTDTVSLAVPNIQISLDREPMLLCYPHPADLAVASYDESFNLYYLMVPGKVVFPSSYFDKQTLNSLLQEYVSCFVRDMMTITNYLAAQMYVASMYTKHLRNTK